VVSQPGFFKKKSHGVNLRIKKLTVIHVTAAMETAITKTFSSIEALCYNHNLSASYRVTASSFSLSETSVHRL